MICYNDMTFCMNAEFCANKETCHRWFSHEHMERATKWWGGDDYPLAMSPFKETCDKWEPVNAS